MTSRTGALSILAISLVLAASDFPSFPSNTSMTPSMSAISAPSQPEAKMEGILALGIIQESRLRWSSSHCCMEAGIEKVGSDFESLDPSPLPCQGSHHSDCNGGLADSTVGPSDYDTWYLQIG